MNSADNTALGIATLIVGAAIYFFPSIIAGGRRHADKAGIILVNLFLGWTFIGWVVALVWAASGKAGSLSKPPATATCPHCAEEILAAAKICKHCHQPVI